MPEVTLIEPQKNNSQRYNVYLDDEFAFGIDEGNLVKFGLHKGQELAQEEVDRIFEESELYKLYSRALDYLSYRPRSVKEVRDYLREKSIKYQASGIKGEAASGVVIQSIIDRLKRSQYLDDGEFTRWWIKQRTETSKPRGPRFIRAELYQKGVDENLIKQVWQELKIDEQQLCLKAAQNRARRYNFSNFKQRKKLFDYLMRRGFNFDAVEDVLKTNLVP